MVGQHAVQADDVALLDPAEAVLAHALRVLVVLPAGVVGCDVNARVRLIPGGEVGVCFGADGPQGAGDEVEDGTDLGLAFCKRKG